MSAESDSIYDAIIVDGEFKNPAYFGAPRDCARCDRRNLNAAIVERIGGRSLCLLCAHSVIEEKHYTADLRIGAQRRFAAKRARTAETVQMERRREELRQEIVHAEQLLRVIRARLEKAPNTLVRKRVEVEISDQITKCDTLKLRMIELKAI